MHVSIVIHAFQKEVFFKVGYTCIIERGKQNERNIKIKKWNLDKNRPKISETAPEEVEGISYGTRRQVFKGVVYPPIGRSMGEVCPNVTKTQNGAGLEMT